MTVSISLEDVMPGVEVRGCVQTPSPGRRGSVSAARLLKTVHHEHRS